MEAFSRLHARKVSIDRKAEHGIAYFESLISQNRAPIAHIARKSIGFDTRMSKAE